jgi:Na+/melibiose symporter-like transporter
MQFRILAIIIVVIGLITTLFYMFTIREPYLVKEAKRLQKEFKMQQKALFQAEEGEKERVKSMSMAVKQWYTWFKEGQFYVYGFVYTLVRMAVNVVMTVQSFYLITVLGFKPNDRFPSPWQVALTPLISYSLSILFQIFVYKKMTQALRNRFLPMAFAILIIIVGSVPLFFLN